MKLNKKLQQFRNNLSPILKDTIFTVGVALAGTAVVGGINLLTGGDTEAKNNPNIPYGQFMHAKEPGFLDKGNNVLGGNDNNTYVAKPKPNS